MSYSRWSFSVWYSFWNASSSGKKKNDQVLSLWFSMDKTIDWVYTDLLEVTAQDIQKFYNCEIEDAEEAMTYINEFIKAVDEEFESVK
jgi:hypothetical protein